MIYLDHSLAVPVKPAVIAAVAEAMARPGCPASQQHRFGRNAQRAVAEARARVAALVGASAEKVLFLERPDLPFPLLSAVNSAGVSSAGREVEQVLRSASPASVFLVPLVHPAHGTIQPVEPVLRMAHRLGHKIVVDLSYAVGRLPVDLKALGADAVVFSANRLGGPMGCAAFVLAESADFRSLVIDSAMDVPSIVGFGLAAQLSIDDLRMVPLMGRWRDRLEDGLAEISGSALTIRGKTQPRVATNSAFSLAGVSAKSLALALDAEGIAVGLADDETIALSFGWNNSAADLRRFVQKWADLYGRGGFASLSHVAA